MFTLAFADFLSAFYNGVIEKGLPLFGFVISSESDFFCAICMFVIYVIMYSSYYLTTLFSLDKCLAVWFPYKYRQYGKPKVAFLATFVVYFAQSLYSLPALFTYRIDQKRNMCYAIDFDYVSFDYYMIVQPKVTSFVNGLLLVGLVLIFTTLTAWKVKSQSSKRRKMGQNNETNRRNHVEIEMVRQMIVVCSVFGCLNMCITISALMLYHLDAETSRDRAIFTMVEAGLSLCVAIITSGNFYFYLFFGKKFRHDFYALLSRELIKT